MGFFGGILGFLREFWGILRGLGFFEGILVFYGYFVFGGCFGVFCGDFMGLLRDLGFFNGISGFSEGILWVF